MTRRAIGVGLVISLAAFASANAAMGLAFEIFDFGIWLVYVTATIALEAWFMGKWMGIPKFQSLGYSIVANGMTSFCCTWGCFAPFLHYPFVGSGSNPNPLGHLFVLLLVFGLVSAFLEAGVWGLAAKRWNKGRPIEQVERVLGFGQGSALMCSLAVHAMGIPLAMAILLIPSEPYKGLMMLTGEARGFERELWLDEALKARTDNYGVIKPIADIQDLAKTGDPEKADRDALFYEVSYGRFSIADRRDRPLRFEFARKPMVLDGGSEPVVQVFRAGSEKPAFVIRGSEVNQEDSRAAEASAAKKRAGIPTK